jgi:hypothetical protein
VPIGDFLGLAFMNKTATEAASFADPVKFDVAIIDLAILR